MMTELFFKQWFFSLLIILLGLSSCTDKCEKMGQCGEYPNCIPCCEEAGSCKEVPTSGLTELPVDPDPIFTRDTSSTENQNPDGTTTVCIKTTTTATQVRQLDNMVATENIDDIIYPGAIIQGRKFLNGELVPVSIPKTGAVLTLNSNIAGNITTSEIVDELTWENVRNAYTNLLVGNDGAITGTGSQFTFFTREAQSNNEFRFNIGLDARYSLTSVEAGFNLERETEKNVVVSNFTQTFYSISVPAIERPFSLFRDGQEFEDPNNEISSDNPPLYVKRVNFGRQFFFKLESNYTASTMETMMSLAIGLPESPAEVEVEVGLSLEKAFNETTIQVIARGGGADYTIQSIEGYEGFKKAITDNASWSPDNPGALISYELRYLNNDLAKVEFGGAENGKYETEDCFLKADKYEVWLDQVMCEKCKHSEGLVNEGGDEVEFRGSVLIRNLETRVEKRYNIEKNVPFETRNGNTIQPYVGAERNFQVFRFIDDDTSNDKIQIIVQAFESDSNADNETFQPINKVIDFYNATDGGQIGLVRGFVAPLYYDHNGNGDLTNNRDIRAAIFFKMKRVE